MNASKDEGEEAVDGFEPLPDEQEQPAEALPQRPSKPSYAFVAVLTTLVLAYTNQSLTGLCFLLAFFSWGGLCVTQLGTVAGRASSLALWGVVTGLAAALLVVQAGVQLLFLVGNDAWASSEDTKEILQLLGCPKALSTVDILWDLVPPLLALIAASAEVSAARSAPAGSRGLRSQRHSLASLAGIRNAGEGAVRALAWAAGRSNARVLAAVSLTGAALLWPSLISLPYEALVLYRILSWAGRRQSSHTAPIRLLQSFTGVHIVMLYLWQIALLRLDSLKGPAGWLGLYVVADQDPAYDIVPKILQLIALHLLFAALGFCHVSRAAAREAEIMQEGLRAGEQAAVGGIAAAEGPFRGRLRTSTLEEFFGEDAGFFDLHSQVQLARRRSMQVDPLDDRAARLRAPDGQGAASPHMEASQRGQGGWSFQDLLELLLPLTAGAMTHALEHLASLPSFAAAALCVFSLVEPSVISAVGLAVGLLVMMTPKRWSGPAFRALSLPLSVFLAVWHACAYTATAVGPHEVLPPVFRSIGIYVFASPPPLMLPLGALLLLTIVTAGLARSSPLLAIQEGPVGGDVDGGLALNQPLLGNSREASVSGMPGSLGLPGKGKKLSVLSALEGREGLEALEEPGINGGSPRSAVGSQGTLGAELDFGGAWEVLGSSTVHAAHYLGFLLIPVAVFLVGVCEYDLLHAGYLAQLLVYFLSSTAKLEPPLETAVVPLRKHLFLRLYASMHLMLMYGAYVSLLPAMGSPLRHVVPDGVLDTLGLLHPSTASSMLPVLSLLLLATVHSSISQWLQWRDPVSTLPPDTASAMSPAASRVPSAYPAALLWISGAVVSAGSFVIVLQGYILLLLRSDASLLGLKYLTILIYTFLNPPTRHRYEEKDHAGQVVGAPQSAAARIYTGRFISIGHRHSVRIVNGSLRRWVPLAVLALFAAAEFAAQYLFIATPFAQAVGIPNSALRFIEDVVGINTSHKGLSVRLLRSASLLGLLHLYRFIFVVGMLQGQLERDVRDPEEQRARDLQAQRGVLALAERFLILHASKVVALMMFWAAMAQPGAIGGLLVVGTVFFSPMLGGPKAATTQRMRLMHIATLTGVLVAAAWMIAQYCLQVPWVSSYLGSRDSMQMRIITYLGLLPAGAKLSMEALLRFKALVLIAVTVKRRSLRWLAQLPEPLKRAGAPHSQCCLFWHPTSADDSWESADLWKHWKASSFGRSVHLAVKDIIRQVEQGSSRVLQAVDWPQSSPDGHCDQDGQNDEAETSPDDDSTGEGEAEEAPQKRNWWLLRKAKQGLQQLQKLNLAFQDWTERFWKDWGLEFNMALLLVAAFYSTNLFSLLYLAITAVGMAAPVQARCLTWRFCVLPLLATVLVEQYFLYIGLPPPWGPSRSGPLWSHRSDTQHSSVKDWLGLGTVTQGELWSIFLALAATIMQVHYDLWHNSPMGQRYSWLAITSGGARQAAGEPLLGQPGGSGHNKCTENQAGVWMPMNREAKKDWSWVDWMRFLFYRHYTDVLLVAVVALCTVENDVIHAAYLALALLLFRRRDALRTERQHLFKWLPLYNFLVMLITLAYQAPFNSTWDHKLRPYLGCNFAHVLGLYRMSDEAGQAFYLRSRGALADMLLWAIFRLQTRVFASNTYIKVMTIVAQEQAEDVQRRGAQRLEARKQQAQAALEHSKLRQLRAHRLSGLKEGIAEKGGLYGLGTTVMDQEPEDDGWADALGDMLGNAPKTIDTTAKDATGESGGLRANALQYVGDPEAARPMWRGLRWRSLLSLKWRQDDNESVFCYVLFMALFVADFSFLAMVFPIVLYVYALLAQAPATRFWQAMLIFTEAILVAQYTYQIPTRLHCRAITPQVQAGFEKAGLHGNAFRCIPIFCAYLSILMHTYSLVRQQEPARALLQRRASSVTSPRTSLQGLLKSPRQSMDGKEGNRHTGGMPGDQRGGPMPQSSPTMTDATGLAVRMWLIRISRLVMGVVLVVWEFLLRVCSSAERPLHFIKVQLRVPAEDVAFYKTADGGEHLRGSIQGVLDWYRDNDIAAEVRRRQEAQNRQRRLEPARLTPQHAGSFDSSVTVDLATVGPLEVSMEQMLCVAEEGTVAALLQVTALKSTPSKTWGLSTVSGYPIRSLKPAQHAGQTLMRCKQDQMLPSQVSATHQPSFMSPATNAASLPRLLRVADHQGQLEDSSSPPRVSPDQDAEASIASSQPSTSGGSGSAGRAGRSLPQPAQYRGNAELVSYPLVESPEQSGPGRPARASASEAPKGRDGQPWAGRAAVPDSSSVKEHPAGPAASSSKMSAHQSSARSGPQSSSAQAEAEVLPDEEKSVQSSNREGGISSARGQPAKPGLPYQVMSSGIGIESVEWHSRIEKDWYAATVFVDLLTFIYVAVFYQAVVASARTLQDITDERVVPVDYLGVLILLFMLLVLDRLFYSLGLHLGKALLLWGQMVLFYWYTMTLFWSPATGAVAKAHLRVLIAIKSLYFTFSAMQLRNGYPPPASYRGSRGRQAFVFARFPNNLGMIAFHVFQAIPFLYELRELLDWSCTSTTLSLFDWLKLEDISISLFFVTVSRRNKKRHRLGQRQPRYMKFFQGTLLFLGLLLLLWVPLLIFSSGNPTYQVPEVVDFKFNMTLGTSQAARAARPTQFVESVTFPLFLGGERRSRAQWASPGSLPGSMQLAYDASQMQLLCVAEDSDRFWRVTPPARRSIQRMLNSSAATLAMSWEVLRNAPLATKNGGPLCQGVQEIPLSAASSQDILNVLQGGKREARLESMIYPNGTAAPNGTVSIYGLFWQLRGGQCNVRRDFGFQEGQRDPQLQQSIACDLLLEGGNVTKGDEVWWRLKCGNLDHRGRPVNNTGMGWAHCGQTLQDGPRIVALLERVQGGIIGQTLSSFGITGLYITFVFGIGRFLRFSTQHARMRIPFEDLPTTKRLIALCQDIYIARAEGELELEEELYWALINIYRSPAVMFEITRKKAE